jgi:TolB protein
VTRNRERVWIGLATALAILICVCSGVGIAAVTWLARGSGGSASAPRPIESSASGRIAYVGVDGNIYTIAPDGGGRRAVTRDRPATQAGYNTLAWSPDGQLAFASANDQGSALFTVQPDGSERTRVYSGGPNVAPFYLDWSPDGQRLAFLSPSRVGGMTLWLADSQVADSSFAAARGSPSYFSWSPDGQSLLSHIGGAQRDSDEAHVAILYSDHSDPTELPDAPGSFQAPAWSPNGQYFLLARQASDATDELVLVEGEDRRVLTASGTGLVFTWSPRGDRIAFSTPSLHTSLLYDRVVVMEPASRAGRVMAQGQIAAFFWSPDGEQLAVLRVDQSQSGPQGRLIPARSSSSLAPQSSSVRLAWSVIRVDDGAAKDYESFRPTDAFLSLIPYFDQYAQSLSLWSPDGRYLVYADVSDRDETFIRVLDTAQANQPAQRLASGVFAAWSWH